MTSQDYLWINVAIGIGLIALFAWRRGNPRPSRLRMKSSASSTPLSPSILGESRKQKKTLDQIDPETVQMANQFRGEKSLNAFFNYNGHMWDAFEVLGLPGGASRNMIEAAYKKMHSEADAQSREFLEVAYRALLEKSA